MKRRRAIKNIIIISSGMALIPSCRPDVSSPVYTNVTLEKGEWDFIEKFTGALLPVTNTGVITPEPPAGFVLTVLNDCYAPSDVQKYLAGLRELQTWLRQKFSAGFERLNRDQQAETFTWLSQPEGLTESVKYFYSTTKRLVVEHFTSSEYFLTNVMDWQFAPGRFIGCATM